MKGKWWIQHWAKDQVQIVEAESEGVAGQTNDHQAMLLTYSLTLLSPGSHKLAQLFHHSEKLFSIQFAYFVPSFKEMKKGDMYSKSY